MLEAHLIQRSGHQIQGTRQVMRSAAKSCQHARYTRCSDPVSPRVRSLLGVLDAAESPA
jgi:hypothetical protein